MLELHFDITNLRRKDARLQRFFREGFLKPFKRFRVYMLRQTALTFRALKQGGSFRGVSWPWYKDQYTRKTDGVTVPAQGGVPRVGRGWARVKSKTGEADTYRMHKRVSGNVKGKKRPSGKRVTTRSNLLRDTGRLAAAAGTTLRFERSGKTMIMGTKVSYAAEQQVRRPFLFFQDPVDVQVLEEYFVEDLRKAIEEEAA